MFAPAAKPPPWFTLTIGGTSEEAAATTVTFSVPPSMPAAQGGLSDQQIIQILQGLRKNPGEWQSTSDYDVQGGSTLIFTRQDFVTNEGAPRVTLRIGPDNALQCFTMIALNKPERVHSVQFQQKKPERAPSRLASDSNEAVTGMKHTSTPPVSPPASRARIVTATAGPSTAEWSHAALQQQAQVQREICDAIQDGMEQFGMHWQALNPVQQSEVLHAASHVSPQAPAGTRAQRIQAVLVRIQLPQTMAWLSSQRQTETLVIYPGHFLPGSKRPATYHDGVTIDGPHESADDDARFYLERPQEGASAQHAANAMIGGPRLSLSDFAWHEAVRQYPAPTQHQIQDIERVQLTQGVHAETVHAALLSVGIATHRFSSVPVPGPGGELAVDSGQFKFLDRLATDRLLLQSDSTKDGWTGISRWVAFRRNGEQWVLLDSLKPQCNMSPSVYLQTEKASYFTAFWPQRRLVTFVDAVVYSYQVARTHWISPRADEFTPFLREWNAATRENFNGTDLLQTLSELCDVERAEGRGTEVAGSDGLVYEFTVTLPGMTAPIRIWRALDGSRVPNLRLAPASDDEHARVTLLNQMLTALRNSNAQRQERLQALIDYSRLDANNHWSGSRQTEFEPYLKAWDKVTGMAHSGAVLLRTLSALCDWELVYGRGTEVFGSGGRVYEFTVTLPEMTTSITVWRSMRENSIPNLRLAPASRQDQARATLLTQMCRR